MIWLTLIVYYTISTVVIAVVLEGYAWLLRRLACLPRPLPLLLGNLLCCVVACALVLSYFGLAFVLDSYMASDTGRLVGLLGWTMSLLFTAWLFKHRHMAALQALGYYQNR